MCAWGSVWACSRLLLTCTDLHNYPSLNDIVGGVGKGRDEEW